MKNESVRKSPEKSKNVLEEKRKMVKQKICIKKDRHVYNNCYELRSRAIKKTLPFRSAPQLSAVKQRVSHVSFPDQLHYTELLIKKRDFSKKRELLSNRPASSWLCQ